MINHYTNLVCWKSISSLQLTQQCEIWCDSISFALLLRIFGHRVELAPGTRLIPFIRNQIKNPECLMLFSGEPDIETECTVRILPFFTDRVTVPKSILSLESTKFKTIFIGISSPKQNELALELAKVFEGSDIYCVGAALDKAFDQNFCAISKHTRKKGFEWLIFLIFDPKRTTFKILQTLRSILEILISRKTNIAWREFAKQVKKE